MSSPLREMDQASRSRILAKMLILNGMLYTMDRDGPVINRYLISHREIVRMSGFRSDLPPGEFNSLRHSLRELGWCMLEASMGEYFLVSNQFVQQAIRLQARHVLPVLEDFTSPVQVEDALNRRIYQYHCQYSTSTNEERHAA